LTAWDDLVYPVEHILLLLLFYRAYHLCHCEPTMRVFVKNGHKMVIAYGGLVSFAAVFGDVTQSSP